MIGGGRRERSDHWHNIGKRGSVDGRFRRGGSGKLFEARGVRSVEGVPHMQGAHMGKTFFRNPPCHYLIS